MSEYTSGRKVNIEPESIVKNYSSFGLEAIHDVDCGDFLRGALFEISKDQNCSTNNVKNLAFVSLEWKFECSKCNRYMTMSLKDFVVKIKVAQEASLKDLLKTFLHTKTCPCGQSCEVPPGVKHLGKYIFLEIDRSIYVGKYSFFEQVCSLKIWLCSGYYNFLEGLNSDFCLGILCFFLFMFIFIFSFIQEPKFQSFLKLQKKLRH